MFRLIGSFVSQFYFSSVFFKKSHFVRANNCLIYRLFFFFFYSFCPFFFQVCDETELRKKVCLSTHLDYKRNCSTLITHCFLCSCPKSIFQMQTSPRDVVVPLYVLLIIHTLNFPFFFLSSFNQRN